MEQATEVRSLPRMPTVRAPAFAFDGAVPRHWFGGNVVGTAIANGVNLLFPAGERFFVRSVNHYLPQIQDPTLRAQVKGFFGQEGRHAREHERVFAMLESQGYDVRRFLRLYERIAFGIFEKVLPRSLALAITAAAEHYTALMAEDALTKDVFQLAHPAMRDLFLWHACEEIEHRAVAFDVLQTVAPSYALRMAGMAVATGLLAGFWMLGAASLLVQERDLGLSQFRTQWAQSRAHGHEEDIFIRGIQQYMRRDFHPLQKDTDTLAQAYLASVGMA